MRFAIISHTEHIKSDAEYLAYAPYVKEMNIWLKYVDEVKIVAPVIDAEPDFLKIPYQHENLQIEKIPGISLLGFKELVKTIFALPMIFLKIYKAMQWAEHIHLRCPGNIGLVACVVQIFFPKKPKTVKYAGNWDPDSEQPWSYKLQKWILSNTFLSKNVEVLVYGKWKNENKNIKAFFTASFAENEKHEKPKKSFSAPYKALFVGTLVKGKRPMFAVQLVEQLKAEGIDISLDLYGDGALRRKIETYLDRKNLRDFIRLKGNQPLDIVKEAYKEAHFLILASKSEGWPKAIAEAMFWGAIPIATNVSCIPWMLDDGKRGILIEPDLLSDSQKIKEFLNQPAKLEVISAQAQSWSRQYTTDRFEVEIKKLLQE